MKKRISIILVTIILIGSMLSTICYAHEIQPRTSVAEEGINPVSELAPEEGINPISETSPEEGIDPISENAPEDNHENQTGTTQPQYDITYADLYAIEEGSYEMDKLISGNAFIIANGNVRFTGEVAGSVYIFANGTVEIEKGSFIEDSLYVFARELKVDGAVYDIYSFTQKFELMENAYVSRNIKVLAEDAKLRGTVYRDVGITAKNIDVKDDTSALVLGGDFDYTSGREIENLKDVVLYGEIHFTLEEENKQVVSVQDKIKDYAYKAITSIVYVLVIYLLLLLISPKFVERVGKDLKEKSIMGFVVGLVSWLVITIAIIVALVLLFTSFGSPITIIASVIMFTVIYISSAIFSISVLDLIKTKFEQIKENRGLEMLTLAGIALVVWILQQIPYLGGLVTFVVLTTGIGLILRNIISKKEVKKENTPVEKVEE